MSRRIDVHAALWGQVRDAPNFSKLTIEQCAVQTDAAIQALSVALDWARAGDAAKAGHYVEDALRLLERAPERVPGFPVMSRGELDDMIGERGADISENDLSNLRAQMAVFCYGR